MMEIVKKCIDSGDWLEPGTLCFGNQTLLILPLSALLISLVIAFGVSLSSFRNLSRGYSPLPTHKEPENRNFRVLLLATLITILSIFQAVLASLEYNESFAAIAWLSMWSCSLFVSMLSLCGLISRPSSIRLYPFFAATLVAKFLSSLQVSDKLIPTIQIVTSLFLVALEIGQRYVESYVEPAPAKNGKNVYRFNIASTIFGIIRQFT